MLTANMLHAQSGNETTPPEEDEKVVVGAIGGTVDVSALGGATYTIPVKVPDGINGVKPSLSIVYNSQGGNGLLGWGWNLACGSVITRVGQTLYHDGVVKGVNFNDDRFALDGQRLMVLDNVPYGANGAEYRTEIDGNSKIVSYTENGVVNGPAWFEVRTADGLIMEYGRTANSRVAYQNGGNKEVGMWLLNKVSDRNGNYMTYHYDNDGESASLKIIYYTIREDQLGCYSVVFGYDQRNDTELSFIGDHAFARKKLLKTIQIKWWDQEDGKV